MEHASVPQVAQSSVPGPEELQLPDASAPVASPISAAAASKNVASRLSTMECFLCRHENGAQQKHFGHFHCFPNHMGKEKTRTKFDLWFSRAREKLPPDVRSRYPAGWVPEFKKRLTVCSKWFENGASIDRDNPTFHFLDGPEWSHVNLKEAEEKSLRYNQQRQFAFVQAMTKEADSIKQQQAKLFEEQEVLQRKMEALEARRQRFAAKYGEDPVKTDENFYRNALRPQLDLVTKNEDGTVASHVALLTLHLLALGIPQELIMPVARAVMHYMSRGNPAVEQAKLPGNTYVNSVVPSLGYLIDLKIALIIARAKELTLKLDSTNVGKAEYLALGLDVYFPGAQFSRQMTPLGNPEIANHTGKEQMDVVAHYFERCKAVLLDNDLQREAVEVTMLKIRNVSADHANSQKKFNKELKVTRDRIVESLPYYNDLSPEEQADLKRIFFSGCLLHKHLNTCKAGQVKLAAIEGAPVWGKSTNTFALLGLLANVLSGRSKKDYQSKRDDMTVFYQRNGLKAPEIRPVMGERSFIDYENALIVYPELERLEEFFENLPKRNDYHNNILLGLKDPRLRPGFRAAVAVGFMFEQPGFHIMESLPASQLGDVLRTQLAFLQNAAKKYPRIETEQLWRKLAPTEVKARVTWERSRNRGRAVFAAARSDMKRNGPEDQITRDLFKAMADKLVEFIRDWLPGGIMCQFQGGLAEVTSADNGACERALAQVKSKKMKSPNMKRDTLESQTRADAFLGSKKDNLRLFDEIPSSAVSKARKNARKRRREEDEYDAETKQRRLDHVAAQDQLLRTRKIARDARLEGLRQVELIKEVKGLEALTALKDVTQQIQAWKCVEGVAKFTDGSNGEVVTVKNPEGPDAFTDGIRLLTRLITSRAT